jgi:ABC-type antimicrobial peptide transport system permease subunit
MATVWLWLRADTRQRWRALLGLALLLGVVGGVVLAAAAGARRTDTAYPRLLSWAGAAQVDVLPGNPDPPYFAALARLPQVTALSSAILYNLALPAAGGVPDTQVQAYASLDGTLGVTMDRVKLLQGRMFRPAAAGEAVVDPQLASMEHLRPGATLRMIGIPYNPKGGAPDLGLSFPVSFLVTGVGVFDDQIVPVTGTNSEPRVLLSPAFSRTARAQSVVYLPEAGVRLRPGASPAAFAATARALAARYPQAQSSYTVVVNLAGEVAATQRAIRPQAVALGVFAGLAGLISLAVIGQLLVRQLSLEAAEFPVLRAIGMTPRSLLALCMARLALVTGVGAVLAAAIAVAASPLTPIGTARLAEPDPGVQVDAPVLAAGLAVIALLPLALLVLPAWRAVRRTAVLPGAAKPATGRARPSLLPMALTSASPVTTGIGMRMAFEPGRGRTAVPVRSALTGTGIAIAALVAAAVFGTSLVGLVSTPARYGANWDAELNIGFAGVSGPFGARVLSAVPAIAGYAAGNTGQVTVDGMEIPAIGVDPVHGGGYLTLLAGRGPAGPREIALGAQTLHASARNSDRPSRLP